MKHRSDGQHPFGLITWAINVTHGKKRLPHQQSLFAQQWWGNNHLNHSRRFCSVGRNFTLKFNNAERQSSAFFPAWILCVYMLCSACHKLKLYSWLTLILPQTEKPNSIVEQVCVVFHLALWFIQWHLVRLDLACFSVLNIWQLIWCGVSRASAGDRPCLRLGNRMPPRRGFFLQFAS